MVLGIDNTNERQPYSDCKIDIDDFKADFANSPPIVTPMKNKVTVTGGKYGYSSIVFLQEDETILGLDETTCLVDLANSNDI